MRYKTEDIIKLYRKIHEVTQESAQRDEILEIILKELAKSSYITGSTLLELANKLDTNYPHHAYITRQLVRINERKGKVELSDSDVELYAILLKHYIKNEENFSKC